jgi:hypothetical protein
MALDILGWKNEAKKKKRSSLVAKLTNKLGRGFSTGEKKIAHSPGDLALHQKGFLKLPY